jgi:uncharacterized protein involved in exopolysaccharide biosynthesis
MSDSRPVSDTSTDISLAELVMRAIHLIRMVRREWRLLVLPTGIALLGGILAAVNSSSDFSASRRLLSYRGASSQQLALPGLAVRPQGPSGSDMLISAALYPDVIKTFDYRRAVAERPIAFGDARAKMSPIEYFRRFNQPSAVARIRQFILGLPGRLLTAVNSRDPLSAHAVPQTKTSVADTESPLSIDPSYRVEVDAVGSRIKVEEDNNGVISISASMPDSVAAADLARVASEELTRTIISFEVKKAEDQLRYLNVQLIESKQRYDAAQQALARFADRNRILTSAIAQIERQRLERDADLAFETYQQFAKEREQARIRLNSETPVFGVLEDVTIPTARKSAGRGRKIVFALFLGLAAGLLRLAWRHLLSNGKLEALAAASR